MCVRVRRGFKPAWGRPGRVGWLIVAVLLAAALCAPTTARAVSAPKTVEVPLKLPAPLSATVFQDGVFAPDGGLWLFANPVDGIHAVVMEVSVRSGRLLLAKRLPLAIDVETVGPDGNIWFGAEQLPSGRLVVGYLNSQGAVRDFALPRSFLGSQVDSVAAGADGRVWFTTSDFEGRRWVGRISTTGRLSLVRVRGEVLEWDGGLLLPDPHGGFWSAAGPTSRPFVHISLSGQTQISGPNIGPPWAEDRFGDIWDWTAGGQLVRRRLNDSITRFSIPPPPGGFPPIVGPSDGPDPGAITPSADGNLWFTEAHASALAPGEHGSGFDEDLLLGTVTPGGTVRTWLSPFSNADGTTLGNGPDPDMLFPGPDGRLYAVGYQAPPVDQPGLAPSGPWHLFAVSLPDHPVMHSTVARVTKVRVVSGQVQVSVHCIGQPGRYCAGQIIVSVGRRRLVPVPYALAPGLTATHTLSVPKSGTLLKQPPLVHATNFDASEF